MPYGFETGGFPEYGYTGPQGTVYPQIPYAPGIPDLGYLDPGPGIGGTSIPWPTLPDLPIPKLPSLPDLPGYGAQVGGTFLGAAFGSAAVPIVGAIALIWVGYKVAKKQRWV